MNEDVLEMFFRRYPQTTRRCWFRLSQLTFGMSHSVSRPHPAKLVWLLGLSLCFQGGASAVSPGVELLICVLSSLAASHFFPTLLLHDRWLPTGASMHELVRCLFRVCHAVSQHNSTAAGRVDSLVLASEIEKRFRTAAVSYRSISVEVHSNLANALNRHGGSPTPRWGRRGSISLPTRAP